MFLVIEIAFSLTAMLNALVFAIMRLVEEGVVLPCIITFESARTTPLLSKRSKSVIGQSEFEDTKRLLNEGVTACSVVLPEIISLSKTRSEGCTGTLKE